MGNESHMPIEQAALNATGQDALGVQAPAGRVVDTVTGEVVPGGRAGGQLDVRLSERIDALLQPFTLNLDEWAEALFDVRDFPETDPDEQSLALLASILLADSSAEVLAAMKMDRAKEMCGDEPGGHSPLLLITGAQPLRSDYEDGPSCYLIVDYVRKVDGYRGRFTTGARAVQAAILAHIARGWMPFEAVLEIRSQKTRRGFYPLNLVAGG